MSQDDLKKTPLFDAHVAVGARMVPFAGYAMPVQYRDGVLKEHLWTRENAGLFDVSHMGQARLRGVSPLSAFEEITPGDFIGLAPGKQRYSVLLNKKGGIIDDLMASRPDGDGLFVIVNGACKDNDFRVIDDELAPQVSIERLEDRALLALQGPAAAAVMARLAPGSETLVFLSQAPLPVAGIDCRVSRSGYTGEDGFEISVPAERALDLAETLLKQPKVKAAGLGARDSLRLEAGLCLYGHELDETISPVEAAVAWTIGTRRRQARDFPGASRILREIAEGPSRIRVGLKVEGRQPVRDGAELTSPSGSVVGRVTSGGFGPSVGGPIAMGYVATPFGKLGTSLNATVRGKPQPVTVVQLPFHRTSYRKT